MNYCKSNDKNTFESENNQSNVIHVRGSVILNSYSDNFMQKRFSKVPSLFREKGICNLVLWNSQHIEWRFPSQETQSTNIIKWYFLHTALEFRKKLCDCSPTPSWSDFRIVFFRQFTSAFGSLRRSFSVFTALAMCVDHWFIVNY